MAHPSAELYGSDRVFCESAIALTLAGWRVLVTLPTDGPLVELLERHGVRVIFCPTPVLRKAALRPRGFLRLLGETARSVRPMWRLLRACRPDAVYVNTVTAPLWLLLGRLTRRRVLAHVHEAEDAVPGPVRIALAAPLLAAGMVVVNSEATGEVVRRSIPLLRRRIRLIYNGVPGPDRPPRDRDRPRDPVRITVVGRLSPRKGTDVAVDAVARLHKAGHAVTLDLVGSVFTGYEWYERQLRERIADAGLNGSVRLRGFDSDVWSAYEHADIAVVPSRFEPFGNTSVEAQLAGVPVIVSAAQGLPETVAHGRAGTIVPVDAPDALAEAITELIDDWPGTLQIAAEAKRAAETRFAPERYRQDIAALFEAPQ
ncbi:MAG: glycosyltransferase [Pseudonocardiaceae bacterium]|nr:glycosyltransferase [Pseudonocardiaceae bacterium]